MGCYCSVLTISWRLVGWCVSEKWVCLLVVNAELRVGGTVDGGLFGWLVGCWVGGDCWLVG